MPAPRLIDSCIKACIRNVRLLTDVGDFEYVTIRPVLKCVTSAKQLHQIEMNSPQIQGEDAELWQAFIARDVSNWRKKNYVPKNPRKWYEIYLRYIKEQQKELERDQEMLRESMLGIKREKETHVSRVVDLRTLPKIPRDPRMIANNGGVPIKGKGTGFRKQAPSALTWNAGSKTKLTDAKSVLTRARREAKEISQRSKLITPTSQLGGRMGQIKQAPAGMVKEYRTAAQPPLRILSRKRGSSNITGGISGPSLEDREARLRAAMSGGRHDDSGLKATYVGSSDEDEEVNADDLFSETPRGKPTPRSASHFSSARASASATKPSEVQRARPATARPSHTGSAAASTSRTASPAPGGRPMMPRKRPEVDVFNRGASKRPKLR